MLRGLLIRVIAVGVLLGALVPSPAMADAWWDQPRESNWTLTVNWQPCNLKVIEWQGTTFVQARKLAGCLPDVQYGWSAWSKEMTLSRKIYLNTDDEQTLEMRMYPETPSVQHLMRLVRYDASGGPYYPDGTRPNGQTWNGGEEYDLSFHKMAPFDYQGSNMVSIRLVAGTLDYSLGVDSNEKVINIQTNGTYYPVSWERAYVQDAHWEMLGDHDWARLTPAVVRSMRSYQAKRYDLLSTLRGSGIKAMEEPFQFRIRTFRPGLSDVPMMDFYLTGGNGWVVQWFENQWELNTYAAKMEKAMYLTGAGAGTVDVAAGAAAYTASAAVISTVAAPLAALTATAIGLDQYRQFQGVQSCVTQVETYYDAIGVGSDAYAEMKSGVILSVSKWGSVVGCHPGYRSAPINSVGVQYGW